MRLSAAIKGDSKLSIAIWAVVESTIALCVASAPALRPLAFRTDFLSKPSCGSPSLPSRSASTRMLRTNTGRAMVVGEDRKLRDVKVTTTVQVTTDLKDIGDSKNGETGQTQFPFQGIEKFTMFEAQVDGGRDVEELVWYK